MTTRESGRVTLFLTALAAAFGAPGSAVAQRTAYEELQVFSSVLNQIRTNYVDTVGYSLLVRSAIQGMLRALDPHSTYYSAADWQRRRQIEGGELATPGVVLESVDGVPTVLGVYEGSPGDRQGVQPGDRVIAVEDTTVLGLQAQEVAIRLAGRKGSRVRVTFERGPRFAPDTFAVRLKRDDFRIRSVGTVLTLDDRTGYVQLREFEARAGRELRDAIRQLRRQGCDRIVLDLRGNPGGLVTAAVDVGSEFFPKGTLVLRTEGRKPGVAEEFVSKDNGDHRDVPLVVLIDERSASAAEALAGALQDHDRAAIVGRRSFGKALMQTGFPLPSGDVVWLTVGYVLTPSGRYIQREYRNVRTELYLELAGTVSAAGDTARVFRTDGGREVRGGGGIRPDIALPPRVAVPVWLSVAADSGYDDAVADSVAHTLGEGDDAQEAWIGAPDRWRAALLVPFLDRVRARLEVQVTPDPALETALARHLARRAAEVRWGAEAAGRLAVRHDPEVAAAVAAFDRLEEVLAKVP